ncbi:MAG: hypothetical protein ACK5KP_09725 [Paludibacteraceae bacterium]
MKTLDLNTYGVQEMNVSEMERTNGGSFIAVLIMATIALAIDYFSDGKVDGHI